LFAREGSRVDSTGIVEQKTDLEEFAGHALFDSRRRRHADDRAGHGGNAASANVPIVRM
jgi:hypothetical protein